ncbi:MULTISPECIES: hypothetical protein [unclassified Streptomyces]|uniref:hypothetical protein n=1 Tax=unclassified Streptomyces TaxID=2593676 RepID=UPI00131A3000|nr:MULTISPECIES: hypothetical protein [unclassified Streptomyces]MYX33292.1 hypothetical protein [Streptomyces sp. SID8377]
MRIASRGAAARAALTGRGRAPLVYGRDRPEDGVSARGGVTLDDLHALFPGC